MAKDDGRTFYTDFSRKAGTAGLVFTEPLRQRPEPTLFVGNSRSAIENELARHAQKMRLATAEVTTVGVRITKTHARFRGQLVDNLLAEPGFLPLQDGYYTGWYFVEHDGITYTALRRPVGDTPKLPSNSLGRRNDNVSRYYALEEQESQDLTDLVQSRPLTDDEVRALARKPHIAAHPLLSELKTIPLEEFATMSRQFSDELWKPIEAGELKGDELLEYFRSNLLLVAIMDRASLDVLHAANAEVEKTMQANGITMYPLRVDGCRVGYLSEEGQMKYRTLPIPAEKQRLFQRYLRFGEKPLTKEELDKRYKALVNRDTKYFEPKR